jgi:UDP-GlcNAc:undecaprenyl-phosphate GlcNAc-1-phosphate transferase
MDGAAPTVAAVSASSIGLVAILSHEVWAAVFALSVAGACAAFLRFNLASPSRIFLGDGGSMPLGLVIAICAIAASERAASGAVTALAAALLFVGLPVLDTCLVIVSRRRRRVSVLTGGRDHVTHRLAAHLGSPRAVALFLAIVQGTLCCAAALAVGTSQLAAWALACLLVAAGLALLTSFLLEARRSPELERSRAVVR